MRLPPFAMVDHQAGQLSTRISIRLRLSWAPGTIYEANRIALSPYGRQRLIAARETNVNMAEGCSLAQNASLIHSRMVFEIWKCNTWDNYLQIWLFSERQMSLLKGRLWEEWRGETVILLCSSSALSWAVFGCRTSRRERLKRNELAVPPPVIWNLKFILWVNGRASPLNRLVLSGGGNFVQR